MEAAPGLCVRSEDEQGVLLFMAFPPQSPDLKKGQNILSHHKTVSLGCSEDNYNNVNPQIMQKKKKKVKSLLERMQAVIRANNRHIKYIVIK